MRKCLYTVFALALLFIGCKKEEPISEPFTLAGKTYAAYAYHSHWSDYDDYDVYWVYKFYETTAERTARKRTFDGGIIGDPDECTYSLNYPNVSIRYYLYGTEMKVEGTFVDEDTFRVQTTTGVMEYNRVK